jgi:hypothetical protein
VFSKCVEFRTSIVDVFLFNHGYSITLLALLIVMFYKVNIVSVALGINFILLYKIGIYRNRYTLEETQEMKVKRLMTSR